MPTVQKKTAEDKPTEAVEKAAAAPKKKAAAKKPAAKKATAKKATARKSTEGAKKPAEGGGSRKLIIVESPTKAKTLKKFLGKDYRVEASVGHVIDLPASKLGVDIEAGFVPHYITIRGKEKILKELKKAAKEADTVLLATDPDREGEAISWHLSRALSLDATQPCRVSITEFTKDVVQEAIDHPTLLDIEKVNSQQARRVLDRIVGYKISPLLWKKVQSGLSAGRVQSVALKLISDREKEVLAFNPEEFWTLHLDFQVNGDPTRAFNAEFKKLDGKNHTIRSKEEIEGVLADLAVAKYAVSEIKSVKKRQNPSPPFITSTLQQLSSRLLNFSTKKTMMIAQQLYEGVEVGKGPMGLITYMRTDSIRVSPKAQEQAAEYIKEAFGADYAPAEPPTYKSGKGAKVQDAHEAIRPSDLQLDFADLKKHLSPDQYKLYTLIWARFMASQMRPAEFHQTTVDATAKADRNAQPHEYLFRAVGRQKLFDGYLRAYEDFPNLAKSVKEALLPALTENEALDKLNEQYKQGFTQPPPRFTEASLVKTLEENGIGRPSTYSAIISTLLDRHYVEKMEKNLHPTELGMTVTQLLTENFEKLMAVDFTAEMENELDEVEKGNFNWQEILGKFYTGFDEALKLAEKNMKDLKKEVEQAGEDCNKCSKPMVIRRGRFGKFIACSGFPECKNTKEFPKEGQVGEAAQSSEIDEVCDKCGNKMQIRRGRFGSFKACTNYPECKSTKPILNTLGVSCPEEGCTGDLVSRMSKKRRIFYGCSRYPDCKFNSWVRPAPGRCPKCNTYLVERRRKNVLTGIACASKECDHVQEIENPEGGEGGSEDQAAAS